MGLRWAGDGEASRKVRFAAARPHNLPELLSVRAVRGWGQFQPRPGEVHPSD